MPDPDELYKEALEAFEELSKVNAKAEELGDQYPQLRAAAVDKACDAADRWQRVTEIRAAFKAAATRREE